MEYMRFEVPQFIEIEDKIFGPLTWRQFLYLGGGVGMAIVMFFTLPFIFFVIFGLPLAALAGALSFLPINSRPFSYFLEAVVMYFRSERKYLWRQRSDIVYKNTGSQRGLQTPRYVTPPQATRPSRNITSLARELELQALQKKE